MRPNYFPIVLLLCCLNDLSSQEGHPDYRFEIFQSGFSSPLGLENAGDGSGRIFIVEKGGRIKIIENGQILSTPFLDLSSIVSTGSEQGLLGLAFHPDYQVNGQFYVHYTNNVGNSQISRFNRSPGNPNQASTTEFPIMQVSQPFANHNAGALRFGPDGYLYIAMGDGGDGGDPGNRAQNKQLLLGKMLRIDVDQGNPYGTPPDNPFVNDATTLDEIWAIGLRNPWRFSFDRETGDLWIGDVGQNAREEINFQPSGSGGGENYGWRCYEGDLPYNLSGCGPIGDYVAPVFVVNHHQTLGNSIAGGFVYRGANLCLQGIYFCAETLRDTLYTLIPNGSNAWSVGKKLISGVSRIVSFGEDETGELYAVSLQGNIYKLQGETTPISGNPIPPGTYTSTGTIAASGSIHTGVVEFIAPESIALNQPFEVLPGVTFQVTLGCAP